MLRKLLLTAFFALCLAFPQTVWGAWKNPELPKAHESENFKIYTNTSKRLAKKVAYVLEVFRRSFVKGFASSQCFGKKLKIRPPKVYIFPNRAAFKKYCAKHKKQFGNREAFFDWRWDGGEAKIKTRWHWRLISFSGRDFKEMQRYLVHELTHIFLNFYLDDIPMWLDEGIAAYMETARIQRGKLRQGYIHKGFLKDFRQAYRNRRQVPFSKLFAMDSESDADFTPLHYAESWAVVHYLLHYGRGRYVKRFRAFLRACAKNGEYDKNFRKYFTTPSRLEREVKKYAFSLRVK